MTNRAAVSKRKFLAKYQEIRQSGKEGPEAWRQTIASMTSDYVEWLKSAGASDEEIAATLDDVRDLAKRNATREKAMARFARN